MDNTLRELAADLLDVAPCSVELPAGSGKTHLVAMVAEISAEREQRCLILTHTNAGVDAIKTRLRNFGVSPKLASVDTITSWAFKLVGAYPTIAGVSVTEVPDWTKSNHYLQGARKVALSKAVALVHKLSFNYLVVDEYQDCTLTQHAFITALNDSIPRAVIFGDRLQAIFGFRDPLANWATDVLPNFPSYQVDPFPYRWRGHNEQLGDWLIEQRDHLVNGEIFDANAHNITDLAFHPIGGATSLVNVAYSFRKNDESVLLLADNRNVAARFARQLNGTFVVMEDVGGRFMEGKLKNLPQDGDYRVAFWLADFAKKCLVGLGDIDAAILTKLKANQKISHLKRKGLTGVIEALDTLCKDPTYSVLLETAKTIEKTPGVSFLRREAWRDSLRAIALSIDNEDSVVSNLGRIRNQLRKAGRRQDNRIASTTLLVKGLEFDHVIIADLSVYSDPRNLYVALSRARKSVSIFGSSPKIALRIAQ